jgi:ABC-type multidrug transport system fused ATPase/permease subunit
MKKKDRNIYLATIVLGLFLNLLDIAGLGLLSITLVNMYSNSMNSDLPKIIMKLNDLILKINVSSSTENLIIVLLLLSITLLLIKTSLMSLSSLYLSKFLAKQHLNISNQLRKDFFGKPINVINNYSSQDIAYILNQGLYYAINLFLSFVSTIIIELVLLVLTFALIFSLFPTESLLILFYFIIIVFTSSRFIVIRSRTMHEISTKGTIEATQSIQEAISLHRELWVSNQHEAFGKKIEISVASSSRGQSNYTYLSQLPKTILEASMIIGISIVALVANSFGARELLIPMISTFTVAAFRLAPSTIRFQSALVSIKSLRSILNSVIDFRSKLNSDFLHHASERLSDDAKLDINSENLRTFLPEIQFHDVSYKFPGESDFVLQNINLSIKPFELVALTGATGAGKSTLIEIMLGLREPTLGEALISGVDAKLAPKLWPKQIAYVSQNLFLVNGTLLENIALGCPIDKVDVERVLELINLLNLNELVEENRGGLNAYLGENGFKVSGGQKQRIGLARALYWKPKLLILDEVTSSQDKHNEDELLNYLVSLRSGLSILIVSHKSNTINYCDRAIAIRSGKLVN